MFNLFDSIQRLNKFPLESTSVQETIESAKKYVENQYSTAYEGQILYIKGDGFYGIFKNDSGSLELSPLLNDKSVEEIAKRVAHDEMTHIFEDGTDHEGESTSAREALENMVTDIAKETILVEDQDLISGETFSALDGGELQ